MHKTDALFHKILCDSFKRDDFRLMEFRVNGMLFYSEIIFWDDWCSWNSYRHFIHRLFFHLFILASWIGLNFLDFSANFLFFFFRTRFISFYTSFKSQVFSLFSRFSFFFFFLYFCKSLLYIFMSVCKYLKGNPLSGNMFNQ